MTPLPVLSTIWGISTAMTLLATYVRHHRHFDLSRIANSYEWVIPKDTLWNFVGKEHRVHTSANSKYRYQCIRACFCTRQASVCRQCQITDCFVTDSTSISGHFCLRTNDDDNSIVGPDSKKSWKTQTHTPKVSCAKPQAQWTWNKKEASTLAALVWYYDCAHIALHTANSQNVYLTKWFASRGVFRAKDGATSVSPIPKRNATLPWTHAAAPK